MSQPIPQNAADNAVTAPQRGFFAKHEVEFYTAMAVGSLALGLISLGVIVSAMGTSPNWYHVDDEAPEYKWQWDDEFNPKEHIIPKEIGFRSDIQNTMQYGAQVGGVALGTCVTGVVLFIVALVMRYRAMKKQHEEVKDKENTDASEISAVKTSAEVASDASSKRWKSILFLLGLSVGTFSAGLMVGSSLILDKGVGHMEDLLQQGRTEFPHTMKYMKEWHEYFHDGERFPSYDYYNLVPSKQSIWDAMQTDWLDPTKATMSGIIPVGIFGALGGGALSAGAIFGRGIFSCYSRCKKSTAEETSS